MGKDLSGANFSRCRRYRYTLWRRWSDEGPQVMIIGLNPSTADAKHDDPTIRRCTRFARDWGGGGLVVVNLFAYRATYPSDLKAEPEPIGPRNDAWIRRMADQSQIVVAAWGNHGTWLDRADRVRRMLKERLSCLRLTAAGQPAHPLYLPARLFPKPWRDGD
ncbi:MAG: DUF1643 domain-containing protein [Wenzhouxiangella sp.]|nr:DUF1643 domain-containing protein [Wenzhouxiangella sp.]